ncbi:MAG: hypothetical protein R6U85_05765, partial [Salinivirgaceae bacterium]
NTGAKVFIAASSEELEQYIAIHITEFIITDTNCELLKKQTKAKTILIGIADKNTDKSAEDRFDYIIRDQNSASEIIRKAVQNMEPTIHDENNSINKFELSANEMKSIPQVLPTINKDILKTFDHLRNRVSIKTLDEFIAQLTELLLHYQLENLEKIVLQLKNYRKAFDILKIKETLQEFEQLIDKYEKSTTNQSGKALNN